MENAAEALKIAFAVLMFGLALTLSMSALSQANLAINNIIELRDKTQRYTYIASTGNNRIVSAETIVPTMYKAYNENFKIVFYKKAGDTLINLPLFYEIDVNTGERKKNGSSDILINYLDLEEEVYGNTDKTSPIAHLNAILSGDPTGTVFGRQLYIEEYPNGLYRDLLKDNYFEEILGEYYQEDKEAGNETPGLEINKTKKRIITYVLQ